MKRLCKNTLFFSNVAHFLIKIYTKRGQNNMYQQYVLNNLTFLEVYYNLNSAEDPVPAHVGRRHPLGRRRYIIAIALYQ